jgi:peptide subunit release factor 1 (eRF1)
MISRADLDRLADHAPTPESPVLSVYLDVDQSRAVNLNREFEAALKTRLRTLEHRLVESERDAFRADAAAVQRFVAGYRPRARTLVLFADDSAGLFWSGELRASLPTDVRWDPTPYVRPLLEVLDANERYGVVLVDKERARLFTVFLGEIEEEREALAAAEVRHKQASGTDHWRSQMHFQRQDEMHVHWHLRQVAELIEDVARVHAFDRLVLAGPVEATSELARLLPRPLGARVVGTLRLPADVPAETVLRETLEVAKRVEREAEETLVAQLLERGSTGLDATLAALQEGRLWILVHADGFASRGTECPRCHALFTANADSACGYCGERLLPLDDLVGRVLERARESGGKIEKVHGEAAARLLDAGGIGAFPRF